MGQKDPKAPKKNAKKKGLLSKPVVESLIPIFLIGTEITL